MPRTVASRDLRWAVGLALLALVLRLAFVLAFGQDDSAGFPANDTLAYDLLARSISGGHGYHFFEGPTVQWPPGYPVVLAAVFGVFGPGVSHTLVLNAVLGTLTVPLLYALAHAVGGRRVAIGAAGLLAVFPGQVLMADVGLSETLYTLELVAFVALAARLNRSLPALLALGLVAGLAALTRGEGLFFPVILLAMGLGPGRRAVALRQAAVVAGVMVLAVVPWSVRNASVADAFVGISTNASNTLWSGHNPGADGGPRFRLELRQGRERGVAAEVHEARVQRRDAVRFAVHNPKRELELIPLKLRSLVRGDSHVITGWINTPVDRPMQGFALSAGRTVADLAWYALLAATLATAVVFGRRLWRDHAVMRGSLAFMALALPLYGFVYYGNFRYRLPLEPLMILTSAAGAQLAWARWRRPA